MDQVADSVRDFVKDKIEDVSDNINDKMTNFEKLLTNINTKTDKLSNEMEAFQLKQNKMEIKVNEIHATNQLLMEVVKNLKQISEQVKNSVQLESSQTVVSQMNRQFEHIETQFMSVSENLNISKMNFEKNLETFNLKVDQQKSDIQNVILSNEQKLVELNEKLITELAKTVEVERNETNKLLCQLIEQKDEKINEKLKAIEAKTNKIAGEMEAGQLNVVNFNFQLADIRAKHTEFNSNLMSKLNHKFEEQKIENKNLIATVNERTAGFYENIIGTTNTILNDVTTFRSQLNEIKNQSEDDQTSSSDDFSWKIYDIEEIVRQKTYECESQLFSVIGYPFKAQTKLQLKSDDHVYMSMAFMDDKNNGKPIPLKVQPRVTYILKDLSKTDKDIVRSFERQFNSVLHFGAYTYELALRRKRLLLNSIYCRSNSITVEIRVDPPSAARSLISDQGILAGEITSYSLRKQKEIGEMSLCYPSPYLYTSPKGYRVQVLLKLNGFGNYKGKGLTANVKFLTGEFDSTLSRSFQHKTTFILYNQLNSTKSVVKSVEKDVIDEYFIDILPHKEIESNGFLNDDSLYYKVLIESKF